MQEEHQQMHSGHKQPFRHTGALQHFAYISGGGPAWVSKVNIQAYVHRPCNVLRLPAFLKA